MNEQLTLLYGYLRGMWQYRWSALVIAWIVAILGWPYVFSLPDQFKSRAVVYIDTTSVLKPLLKGLAPETDSSDEIRVMTRVLLSRDNLLSVIRETDMDLELDSQQQRENMVRALAGSIVIKGGASGKKKKAPKSNIYEISYQSSSANRSYQVVSTLLNTMIEGTLSSTRTDAITAHRFLDTQIVDYEKRLSLAEQQLAEFKKANVGFMPDEKGGYYMRLQRAQDNVEKNQSALRLAQRRNKELKRQLRGESPILGGAGYQSSTDLQIQRYQEQLNSLLNHYTEQHPDVQALILIIEDLKSNRVAGIGETASLSADDSTEYNPVYQEMKVELSRSSVEIETLKIQLLDYESDVSKLKSSVDIIPEVEAELAKLNRDYDVTHRRYLSLVERRESAQLAQNMGQSSSNITFRVIEPPLVAHRPTGPNRVLLLSGVLVAAMGAGLGWSFVRYILQPAFINMRQLGAVTGLPVLGSVGLYLSPEHIKKRRQQLILFLSATFLLVLFFGLVLVVSKLW
jgi:polysaccharide chain length determinant protein (PEP-CTERM system associated)